MTATPATRLEFFRLIIMDLHADMERQSIRLVLPNNGVSIKQQEKKKVKKRTKRSVKKQVSRKEHMMEGREELRKQASKQEKNWKQSINVNK